MECRKLYKKDSNGNMRVWWIEYTENQYRTHSGVLDGKIVTSGWKSTEEKNVGKANATSLFEQIESEVESRYTHQLYQGKYYDSLEEAKEGKPKFFAPMLAKKYEEKHAEDQMYSQPKLDGIRCVADVHGLWTRQGKPIVSCPHIREDLEDFFEENPEAVLDGELYNHKLKHDFEKITSLVRKGKPKPEDLEECKLMVEYHVYDILAGPESSESTFQVRNKVLDNVFSRDTLGGSIVEVPTRKISMDEVESTFAEYIELGYEGQMIRLKDSLYEEGKRPKGLMKHKSFEDAEYKIVDIVEGVGNWAGYAKSIEIELEDGSTQHAGMRGNQEHNKNILEMRDDLIGTDVTVSFQGRTSDNKLRFPVVTKFWFGERDV